MALNSKVYVWHHGGVLYNLLFMLYSSCLQNPFGATLPTELVCVHKNLCVIFAYYELAEKVAITDDPYISDLSIMLKAHAVDSCNWVCHMLAAWLLHILCD